MTELISFIVGESTDFNMVTVVAFFCFCLILNAICDMIRSFSRSAKS